MSDPTDIASENEQIHRDAAIAARRPVIDVAPRVCAGCDVKVQQRACPDFKECLVDYEKRESAAKRNGRAW